MVRVSVFRPLQFLLLALLVAVAFAPPCLAQGLEGRWDGTIATGGPQGDLRIIAEFKAAGGIWQGTIEIPRQSTVAFPLKSVEFAAPSVKFAFEPQPGLLLTFDGKLDGNKISGTFSQGGMGFPFTLTRKGADEEQDLPPGMIPRALLFGNPEKALPQISPDGRRLAYLAPNKDGVQNVWVRTVGKEDDEVVTSDKKRGIRDYSWQWDSENILYVQDKDGDENWNLYQTNLKNKRTRNLTPFDGIAAQIVASDSKFPDTLLVGLNLDDPRAHDVYRLNVKTGALELDTRNPGDVAGWTADNNLVVRVAQIFTPDGGNEFRTRLDAKSPWKSFYKFGRTETPGDVYGFSPDNKLVWLASSVDANTLRLLEMDPATGKSKVLAEDKTYDVSGAMIHPTSHRIQAVSFIRERRDWEVKDPAVQPDFDELRKVRDGDFNVISRDVADKNWVVSYVLDSAPTSYYLYDRLQKRAFFLFTARPKLEKYKLAAMKPISFESRDGLKIAGYLTMPNGKEKNAPMVMLVHGGPWGRDTWGPSNFVQWLANRGYAVLQVNFRGSTGYGKQFMNAGDREWGAKMHDDLLDGKKWAIDQGYADANKICIMGGSYGGYATLVGVTFTPDAFACGVDIVGPSNLVTLLKSIPPYWEPVRAMFRQRMGNEETEEDFLKSRSPLYKADQIRVPLLVAQGANDPRVKQAESDQIVAAARKNGKEVLYLVFPDEGHGFARPENNLKFTAAAEEFLARVLGGAVQPPTAKEKWDDVKK